MGCNQMWCVACDTAWDWNTQRVINGTIHNPHYHEYLERRRREGRDVAAPRVAGGGPPGGGGTHNDMIVCGDVPNWANNNVLDHVYARFRHTKRHNGYYETAMAVERERRLHECYRCVSVCTALLHNT